MYIESVPNRNSPPASLLRASYHENTQVRKRTLGNLSDWPTAHVEGLRGVPKGGTVMPPDRDAFTISRALPHGPVAAALGTARKIGLDRILGPEGNRCRDLVLAMSIARIIDPGSKLAAASITSPDFPGERLIVCRNRELAAERTRKRQERLAATERDLGRIQTPSSASVTRCAPVPKSGWRSGP